jgi:cytochrome c oxidase subunit 2
LRRPTSKPGKVLGFIVLGSVLVLSMSSCIPTGISAKSRDVHGLFYLIFWLALPVFIFVEGMLITSMIRFRRRKGDDSLPSQYGGSNTITALFFAGPLVIITLLLGFGETTLAKVEKPVAAGGEHLRISGFQWEWSADYADQGFTVTGKTLQKKMVMELPVNQPVHVTLLSQDVMHEFFVPNLLFMKNAIPGHPNTFSFVPDKLGTYHGRCAQFCGLYHSRMTFVMKIVSASEYKKWVQQEKKAATAPATCAATGSKVELIAQNISWNTSCLGVVGGKSFQVEIDNKDSGVAHNFAIYDSSKLQHRYYLSPNVTGPSDKTFTAPPLQPGTYYFQCNIHGPAMSGTFIVGKP